MLSITMDALAFGLRRTLGGNSPVKKCTSITRQLTHLLQSRALVPAAAKFGVRLFSTYFHLRLEPVGEILNPQALYPSTPAVCLFVPCFCYLIVNSLLFLRSTPDVCPRDFPLRSVVSLRIAAQSSARPHTLRIGAPGH